MIDTLKASEAGFSKAQIEVLKEGETNLVTREYLDAKLEAQESRQDGKRDRSFASLELRFSAIESRLSSLDTKAKIVIALALAIFIKSFFP